MVPKPRDGEALRLNPSVTPKIATIVGMLRAVAFDDETMFEADKVDEESAKGNLPAPLRRLQPTISQKTPQCSFGVGLLSAHRASALFGDWKNGTVMDWHDRLTRSSAGAPSPLAGEGVAPKARRMRGPAP
jgi:hypothetical protein